MSRIETNRLNFSPVKEIERMPQKFFAYTPAARFLIDKDHCNPRHILKDTGSRGPNGTSIQLGREASFRLHIHKSPPVRFELVPSRLPGQSQSQPQVVDCHLSNLYHIRKLYKIPPGRESLAFLFTAKGTENHEER